MNTYETYVTGVTGRRLTIQAENQKAAEIEALREFTALVGAESNVEVIDITRTDGEDEDEGLMNILIKNVNINLLRKQIHYMNELASEDRYFQGSPCFGFDSADEGLEGVRNLLENMLDIAEEES